MTAASATFSDKVRLVGRIAQVGTGSLQPEFQADYVCNVIMTRTAHAARDLESFKAVNV